MHSSTHELFVRFLCSSAALIRMNILWKGSEKRHKEVTSLGFDIQSMGHLIGILPSRFVIILFSVCWNRTSKQHNASPHLFLFFFVFHTKNLGRRNLFLHNCYLKNNRVSVSVFARNNWFIRTPSEFSLHPALLVGWYWLIGIRGFFGHFNNN